MGSRERAAMDLSRMISRGAAVLAVSSGVIHLAVVRHHLDYAAMSAAFALMGGAQLLVAARLLIKPSPSVRLIGLLLHAWIVATWLLSRTVGLVVVPGAEGRAPFGLADTVANVFAVGVIASLVTIDRVHRGSVRAAFSSRVARAALPVIAVTALSLTLPAAFASHHHADHDHPTTGEPAPGHAPPVDGHDDHDHG
jgi:hypothetical protein